MDNDIVKLVSEIVEFGSDYIVHPDMWEIVEESIYYYEKIKEGDAYSVLEAMQNALPDISDIDALNVWFDLYKRVFGYIR